jgi:hypothetical protein
MKLLFISVTLALVAPLAACTSNNSVASNTIQSPTTQSSPAPKITPASTTQDWYNYTAKDGSYSIKFPHQPKEQDNSTNTKLGEIKLAQVMYEDKAKNRAFMTQSNTIPVTPEQFNAEKGLDGFRDSQNKNGGKVISEKQISLEGFPGREIIVQDKNKFVMKSRIFVNSAKPAMYMAIVVAGDGNLNFPEAQTFLDSFIPK